MSYFAPIPWLAAGPADALSRQAFCDLSTELAVTEAELDLLAFWLLDEVRELGTERRGGILGKGKE